MDLPGVLQDIADLIGVQAMLKLVDACGGTEIYIPSTTLMARDEWSAHASLPTRAIGVANMAKLATAFGGSHIEIPRATRHQKAMRNAAIRRAVEAGRSKQALARSEKITTRHIRRICNGGAIDPRQIDLFDRDDSEA